MARKQIRYALTPGLVSPISGGGSPRSGIRVPWAEDHDNPASPHFIPTEERGEIGKARFWARHEKRKRDVRKAGQFDP